MGKPILISPLFLLLAMTISLRGILAVDYTFTNNATGTRGSMVFTNQIGEDYTKQTLSKATNFIWQIFQESTATAADRKPYTQVTLVLQPNILFQGNSVPAVTSGSQIQVNAAYLAGYTGNVKTEFTGIVYHEMTHVWQWFGNGQANGGLIEGIADYVRLKAGLPAAGWVQPGAGTRWDQGYSVTARFLDYCESLMSGFVAQLNKKMKDSYSDGFFKDLLGKSVDQLWSDYKAKYGN